MCTWLWGHGCAGRGSLSWKHWSFWQHCAMDLACYKMLLGIEVRLHRLSLQFKFLVHCVREIREKTRIVCDLPFLSRPAEQSVLKRPYTSLLSQAVTHWPWLHHLLCQEILGKSSLHVHSFDRHEFTDRVHCKTFLLGGCKKPAHYRNSRIFPSSSSL